MTLMRPEIAAKTGTDDSAIVAVIRAETVAFHSGDVTAWADCFVPSSRTLEMMSGPGVGLVVNRGWDAMLAYTEASVSRGASCHALDFTQTNHQITADGDMAWVVYDGTTLHQGGVTSETFETRILERHNGRWLIAYASFVIRQFAIADERRIAVDGTGHALHLCDAQRDALRDHPGLTLSAGRVRAKRPLWDKALQDAFQRAGQMHGFFDQHGYIEKTGRAFRCPVVLGEGEDGGLITCTLTVRDGVTYIDLGDPAALTEALTIAGAIFGLSPAQTSLATEIIAGKPLPAAAEALSITTNTARTHLSRIYKKTGVNSQPALVRLLLSVG